MSRKVTCPCGCAVSFVPPSVPRKSKSLLRSDDECVAGYSIMREKVVARYGVPFRPDNALTGARLSKCAGCNHTIGCSELCVLGLCGKCYAVASARPCILCRKPLTTRDGNDVCAACTPRWQDMNERAAEVARQNAA